MREISFRAWDHDTNKYLQDIKGIHFGSEIYVSLLGCDGCYIFYPNVTIEQYTGLKDGTKWEDLTEKERENWTRSGKLPSEWEGKKIYDGDILTGGFVVKFEISDSIECLGHDIYVNVKRSGFKTDNYYGEVETIGNIHENKDLIKE